MATRCSKVLNAVRHAIERELRLIRAPQNVKLTLLDVGCWDGSSTESYGRILDARTFGIEVFHREAQRARNRGIDVKEVDIESQPFPWPESSFDVIVVNQVFEHLKNVWLPMSEVARVVRVGGRLIFSVPNLSSLHNRAMLAFGVQPSSIRTFGPHVRGFAFSETRQFLEYGGCFRVRRTRGVGFYPFPTAIARPLAAAIPSASHTVVFIAERLGQGDPGAWLRHASGSATSEQTFYLRGDQISAASEK
jgi:SAM-dependent methyltransferase